MAYVNIPKDLSGVKNKILFNLTLRQLVCFGMAAAVGVPLFFLLRHIGIAGGTSSILMIVAVLPFFLAAMYEKNGQPLEKILKNMADVMFLKPKKRPYVTKNFYDILSRQDKFDSEVYEIIHGKSRQ